MKQQFAAFNGSIFSLAMGLLLPVAIAHGEPATEAAAPAEASANNSAAEIHPAGGDYASLLAATLPIASQQPLAEPDSQERDQRLARLPATISQPLANSWRALAADDLTIAHQALEPLLATAPVHPEALLLLGEIALRAQDWPRASLLFAAAVNNSNDDGVRVAGRERLSLLQASWADDPNWQPQAVSSGLRLPLRFLFSNQIAPRPSRYLNVTSSPHLAWQSRGNPRFATLSAPDQLVVYDQQQDRLLSLPLPGQPVAMVLTADLAYGWRNDSSLLWRWQLPSWKPLAPANLSRLADDSWQLENGANPAQPLASKAFLVMRNANDIQLIDAAGGDPLVIEAPQSGPLVAVAINPDGGSALVYLPQQQRLEWWDLNNRHRRGVAPVAALGGLPASFTNINWQQQQGQLTAAGDDSLRLTFTLTSDGLITTRQLGSDRSELLSNRGDLLLEADNGNLQISLGAHRYQRPATPRTLAHGNWLIQYDPQQTLVQLYDLSSGQLLRTLNFELPAVTANPHMALAMVGDYQLLVTLSGYPPFVANLPDGELAQVLVAESDQPLQQVLAMDDGSVLSVHDSRDGQSDGELFIWEPQQLAAEVAALIPQLPPTADEAPLAYVERLANLSAPYCGRVFPLNYDAQAGIYSVEWQGAEVDIVVQPHSRPPRGKRLYLCGTLHAVTADQLELRAITLENH